MPLSVARLDEALRRILCQFEADRDGRAFLRARSDLVDEVVRQSASEHLPPVTPDNAYALCAVGGYGRRELFPYSDVDLLLLTEKEDQLQAVGSEISEFLRVLWDSGLRLSHSVRTLAECTRLNEENPELQISLLDLRYVAGTMRLAVQLKDKFRASLERSRSALLRRLLVMTQARHHKFNNTVYHLEPNVKDTCGGLRDLHLLRWLAQLLPQRELLAEALAEIEPNDASYDVSAAGFLNRQRCFLHARYKRDGNLLTFDLQDASARHLPPEPLAPEAWMRLYYGHARRVFHSAQRALEYADMQGASLVSQFRDWRTRLSTSEFTVIRERIFLRNPAETLNSAESVLRVFTFAGRHALQLSWDVVRRIRFVLPTLREAFENSPPSWSAWREFFSQPHTALALDEMNKTGVLSRAIPYWDAIDSLVVRDFYHRYTVDEHTILAIRAVDDLVNRAPDTPTRFQQLASEEDQLSSLRLALLLHDLGKGTLPGEHVRGSLETAPRIMDFLQVPESQQSSVLFLISHHLDLSLVMSGRDLDDPATARALTACIETQEDLRRLTLLTYADISAVNPTAMTPWRLEQLWRVYLLGSEQLTRELASNRLHVLNTTAPWTPKQARFLEGFPKRYLRTHPPEQIAHHVELASLSEKEGVAVEIRPEAGAWLMTVLTHDKPGLFASVCGVLASFGMNILKGEASSNASGLALDLIRFADPTRTLELNPEELNRLSWTVQCVVRGTLQVSDLLRRRRPGRRPTSEATIVPVVHFNNEASDAATLIDFTGEDRPGLLYDLCSAVSANGCNLEVVVIDTEAHKAMDVFYVTCGGAKLDDCTQERLRADLLKAAGQELNIQI